MTINKKEYSLILKDLLSRPSSDIQTLYTFYNVDSLPDLISRIYKKGLLAVPSIFDAIRSYNNDEAKEIINSPGFDINDQDSSGNTALILAISYNNKKIVKLLLNRGADPNIAYGYVAKLLINSKNINLNLKNIGGNSALTVALKNNNVEIAKLLIDRGAEWNDTDLSLINKNNNLIYYIIDNNIKIPKEIRNKIPNYITLKIQTLMNQIEMLKDALEIGEKEFVEENRACESKDIEELEKCIEMEEEMIKYRPGGKLEKELEKKYETHPYFSKGTV